MAKDRCEVHVIHQDRVDKARKNLLDDRIYGTLADTFSALADSNRAKIIYSLIAQELCVCDLACVVGISESAVSQHLRILRTFRIVRQRKEGRKMYYSLDDEHVRTLITVCLEHAEHG